jgi:hypothetical protein
MDDIPAPEYLADELYAGEKWLYGLKQGDTVEAPTSPFTTCQEFSQYYSYAPDNQSQITKSEYKTLSSGVYYDEINYSPSTYKQTFSDWTIFPVADSPDNFPGGKNGQTPLSEPALTLQGQDYKFEWESQEAYVKEMSKDILAIGGEIQGNRYKIPLLSSQTVQVYLPESTISNNPPQPDILTSSWYSDRN